MPLFTRFQIRLKIPIRDTPTFETRREFFALRMRGASEYSPQATP